MRRLEIPLAAAAAAAVAGGLGNVAFSTHSGTALGLAAARYAFGIALAYAWMRAVGIRRQKPGMDGTLTAVAGGAAPMLLMLASEGATTASFTLIGGLAPVAALAVGRALGQHRTGRRENLLAVTAVTLSIVAVGGGTDTGTGAAYAAASAVALGTSLAYAGRCRHLHPAQMVGDLCVYGLAWTAGLVAAGGEIRIAGSTVAVAAFVAAVPGGVGKAAGLWAAGRAPGHLVASILTFAVVPAAVGGWLILGEEIGVRTAVAGAGAAAAVAALAHGPRPAAGRREQAAQP